MNRNDRAIVGLVTSAHAMVHTYELSVPVLVPLWLSQFDVIDLFIVQFPVNPATLGGLVTVGYALFGVGALPSGVLVDRVPAPTLIAACLVGMGVAFLGLSLAPSPVFVGLALTVWGAAASIYHPSGLSLISRGVEARGNAFAYHGMAGNVGIALGPFVTALLLLRFDWQVVVALLGVPAFVLAGFALRTNIDERAAVAADGSSDRATPSADGGETTDDTAASLADLLTTARALFASAFVVVFAITIFSGTFYRGVLTFLPELLGDVPALTPVEFGGRTYAPSDYVYTGLLVVGVFGQYLAGRLTDHLRPERGLLVGFAALSVVAVLFLPAAGMGLGPLLVAAALLGFALFFVQPLYQATVAEYTPAEARGLSYGFTYLGTFGVGALGATIAGGLLTYASPAVLFVVLAGVAACASLLGGYLSVRAPSTSAVP